MLEDYISVKEASERYGLSGGQLRRLLAEGKIKGIKIGSYWAVIPSSVEEYKATNPKPGPKKGAKSG